MAVPNSDARHDWTISPELRLQLLAELASTKDGCPKMTWEEFHDWADEDTTAEWVDGEILVPSPVSLRHQRIANFLYRVLSDFVVAHVGGEVLNAPFMMKLGSSAREPDVLVVSREHLDRLKEAYLDGPADLAVEVLSPESIGRDRGDKFFEYERAGIPEYWLIDPATHRAEFYQLNPDGAYQLVAPDADGVYHSPQVQGFWLRVAWLWEEPLPNVDDVLLEVGGEAYARQQMERLRRRSVIPEGE
jgi:Uma2 family endonuclease